MAASAPMMPRHELKPDASAPSSLISVIASLSVTMVVSAFLEKAFSSAGIFGLVQEDDSRVCASFFYG